MGILLPNYVVNSRWRNMAIAYNCNEDHSHNIRKMMGESLMIYAIIGGLIFAGIDTLMFMYFRRKSDQLLIQQHAKIRNYCANK